MARNNDQDNDRYDRCRLMHAIAFLICLSLCAVSIAACGSGSAPAGKRYHLTGKVLSVAKEEGSATVDADDIPGFMSAMAMPYPIPDQKALATLSAGDQITADVVVTEDGKYHLENIVVTRKGDGTTKEPAADNLHQPQPGEKVPNFALVNQEGKTIHLDSFKGKVALITFIYTRCPFADYCPLVSRNFAQIYGAMRANPELASKVRLLSISFDPTHDTPQVLRQYGSTFHATTGGNPFDRWQFATAPPRDLEKITQFFGVFYDPSGGEVVHSLSTSVISPDGTIYKWYSGNEWKPSDLLEDAAKALATAKASSPKSASSVRG
jgi:protein SCO1/2